MAARASKTNESQKKDGIDEVCLENPLKRVSHWIESTIAHFYYSLGHAIARHPTPFVAVPTIIMVLFAVRIFAGTVDPEEDPEDLYTPQDSIAFAQRIVVEERYGFAPVTNFMYLKANDILSTANTNAQNQAALLSLLALYNALTTHTFVGDKETVTYASRCNTTGTGCQEHSVLNFFNYNETAILSDSNVMGTINGGLVAAAATSDFLLSKNILFGGVEPANASDPTVSSVQVLAHRFDLINREERVNGDLQRDDPREKWEIGASKAVRNTDVDVGSVSVLFAGDVAKETEGAIDLDVTLLPFGYMLLVAYASFVLSRNHPVYSYSSMALVSIIAIGLAIVGMWGFGLLVGVPYALVVQGSFFLLLGLGVDDTFVIMGSHRDVQRSLSPAERVARALARGGVSITITSVTDIVAFAAGNLTSLPSIRIFCTYTLLGILFDFLLQITFVVAFLFWNTVREQAGRADFFVWLKPRHTTKTCSNEEFDPDEPSSLDIIMGKWLPKVLFHPVGKAAVLVGTLALAGSSIHAATMVESRFNYTWFIPSESHAQKAVGVQTQYFNTGGSGFGAYTGETISGYENTTTQLSLLQLSQELLDNEYITTCRSIWIVQLVDFANATFPNNVTSQGVIEEDSFYPILSTFLHTMAGARFNDALVFNSSTGLISTSQIFCEFGNIVQEGTQVEAMRSVRSVVDSFTSLGSPAIITQRGEAQFPFAYAYEFLFFDGLAVIKQETLRNVLIAGVAVAVVTLLLLSNVVASFLVVLMLALVDVNVLGFMYYTGVYFNSVSAVNIVIAVGLAIDSSVHIAHAFLTAHGTRDERATEALRRLGRSVTNGAVSTFLAIVVLANAQSYIFQVLFTLLALIIFFAFIHGVIVLPVILSLIGPDPYPLKPHEAEGYDEEGDETEQQREQKETRLAASGTANGTSNGTNAKVDGLGSISPARVERISPEGNTDHGNGNGNSRTTTNGKTKTTTTTTTNRTADSNGNTIGPIMDIASE